MEDGKTRIVIFYSIWATICAAVAGFAMALIHTWFFSYNPGRSAVMETLFSGSMVAVAIAAGEGAGGPLAGRLLSPMGGAPPVTPPRRPRRGPFCFLVDLPH